jgi:hypothetical protein
VDANPLGVDPSANLEDCGKLIGIWISVGQDERIKASNDRLNRAFECRECGRYVTCRDAEPAADVNLDFLEAGFTAESADVTSIWNREVAEAFGVPLARRFQ